VLNVVFLSVLALSLTGCLATRQEIEDLRADILRLQGTLGQSQEKVHTSLKANQTTVQGNQADLMSQMSTLSRDLEVLSAHLQESQGRMSTLSTRLDDLDKNFSNRLDLLSKSVTHGKGPTVPPSPSGLFTAAYNDFTRQRYKQSLEGFQDYLTHYSDTDKAADARFYVGECYTALQEWRKALEAYETVFSHHGTSSIVPTAYLHKGNVLEKLGEREAALAVYKVILEKYPHRQEVLAAKDRLGDLEKRP
jgi:tol-pal system protein YbgF